MKRNDCLKDIVNWPPLFLNTFKVISQFAPKYPLNPLTPNSDEQEIALYIITIWSNIQVMRIKEVITMDMTS